MANAIETLNMEKMKIVHSEEYAAYIDALCKLSSAYISPIRVKFAERAYEKYADPTIRKLVMAYGSEYDKREKDRLRNFKYVADYGAVTEKHLEDFCLNNTNAYGKAIWFLFGIDDKEGEE